MSNARWSAGPGQVAAMWWSALGGPTWLDVEVRCRRELHVDEMGPPPVLGGDAMREVAMLASRFDRPAATRPHARR